GRRRRGGDLEHERLRRNQGGSAEMIRLQNVNKVYRTDRVETLALQNINLDVAGGDFVSIMGPSGCGKSTLLNLIGLLDAPTEGHLALDDTRINGAGDGKLARFRNEKL